MWDGCLPSPFQPLPITSGWRLQKIDAAFLPSAITTIGIDATWRRASHRATSRRCYPCLIGYVTTICTCCLPLRCFLNRAAGLTATANQIAATGAHEAPIPSREPTRSRSCCCRAPPSLPGPTLAQHQDGTRAIASLWSPPVSAGCCHLTIIAFQAGAWLPTTHSHPYSPQGSCLPQEVPTSILEPPNLSTFTCAQGI